MNTTHLRYIVAIGSIADTKSKQWWSAENELSLDNCHEIRDRVTYPQEINHASHLSSCPQGTISSMGRPILEMMFAGKELSSAQLLRWQNETIRAH